MSAIVKLSADDLAWLWPGRDPADCASEILAWGPELVVATLGAGGAIALGRSARASAPAFRVEVADTIGAGDTFHAAFLAALDEAGAATRADLRALDGVQLAAALRRANAAAALDCTRRGAEPPTAAELAAFLEVRRE